MVSTEPTSLCKNFTYSDFDTKFLRNQDIEEVKFFFVYNLMVMQNHDKIDHENLRNNDFSKLRNLDNISNLCLIIDEVMKNKTNQSYVSDSVIEICKNNLGESKAYEIFKSLDFQNNFENAVKKCLIGNHTYDSRTISKETLILILVWGLRNFGSHNIEARDLFVTEYESIIKKLMDALFLILEKVY